MLGYKPFFKEYTTDWEYAVEKMKGSFFQRRLVEESFSAAKPWHEQVKLSSGAKPTNAEFEPWTLAMGHEVGRVPNSSMNGSVNGNANEGMHGDVNGVHGVSLGLAKKSA